MNKIKNTPASAGVLLCKDYARAFFFAVFFATFFFFFAGIGIFFILVYRVATTPIIFSRGKKLTIDLV